MQPRNGCQYSLDRIRLQLVDAMAARGSVLPGSISVRDGPPAVPQCHYAGHLSDSVMLVTYVT